MKAAKTRWPCFRSGGLSCFNDQFLVPVVDKQEESKMQTCVQAFVLSQHGRNRGALTVGVAGRGRWSGGGLKRSLEFGTHSLGIPQTPLSLKAPNSSQPRPFILLSATRKDPANSSMRPHFFHICIFFRRVLHVEHGCCSDLQDKDPLAEVEEKVSAASGFLQELYTSILTV